MSQFLQIIAHTRNRSPYLYQEDFEGTGVPFGWTWDGVGTCSFDNASSVSPAGGQNLLTAAGTNTFAGGGQKVLPSPFPTNTFSMYFQARFSEFSKNINRIIWITDAFTFSLFNAAPSASCTYGFIVPLSSNTWYHIWIDQTPNTGSFYVSTTSTKPAVPHARLTTTGSLGNLSRMRCNFSRPGGYMIDKIRISSTEIGSNPR